MRANRSRLTAALTAVVIVSLGLTGTAGAHEPQERPSTSSASQKGFEISTELEQLIGDQGAALSDVWAGSELVGDDQVVIGLTTDQVPRELVRPEITVVRRAHSAVHLDRVIEAVALKLNALLARGSPHPQSARWPWEAEVNQRESVVDITVDESQRHRREEVERAVADEVRSGTARVGYGTVRESETTCHTRSDCNNPFRGGTDVNSSTGAQCTLGFVMRNNANGDRAQSTASHCPGSPWSHNGIAIGPTTFTQVATGVDFKVIRQNNEGEPAPTNWVRRAAGTVAIALKQVSPGSIGTNVCQEGRNSGEACGPITATNRTHSGVSGFGSFGPTGTCPGDSGAAILNPANNRAYGILKGRFGSGSGCFSAEIAFTWINNAESASGYSVLLSTTSATLAPGQRMPAGYALMADNGSYNLQMQSDGNLVIYLNGVAQWATATNGNPGSVLIMQNDGNLVLYRPDGAVLWYRPGSTRVANSRLVMQTDGNLVIYTPSGGAPWHRFCNCGPS